MIAILNLFLSLFILFVILLGLCIFCLVKGLEEQEAKETTIDI